MKPHDHESPATGAQPGAEIRPVDQGVGDSVRTGCAPGSTQLADAADCLIDLTAGPTAPASLSSTTPEGEHNDLPYRLANKLERKGVSPESVETALLGENNKSCGPSLGEEEIRKIVSNAGRSSNVSPTEGSVWDNAVSAAAFVTQVPTPVNWMIENLVAPATVTVLPSPRGIGKTHLAHHIAVQIALGGTFCGNAVKPGKVMIVDRDNSARELRRRLHGWGGDTAKDQLKILTRDLQAPPLTDKKAWDEFPAQEYSLVVIDSLSAGTEGVDEKEGGASGKALAPVLDLARRGPALLILANTTKDGGVLRGSGVISDRADIVYEVRDATDWAPDPKKEAWHESLPVEGEAAWASKAKRRRGRDDYRLALVPSKFRIGEQPDPFVLELQLTPPWSVTDVTAEIEAKHRGLRGAANPAIPAALNEIENLVALRQQQGQPLAKADAVELLQKNFTRYDARQLVRGGCGSRWLEQQTPHPGGKGRPITVLIPMPAAVNAVSQNLTAPATPATGFSADTGAEGRQKMPVTTALGQNGGESPDFLPSLDGAPTLGPVEVQDGLLDEINGRQPEPAADGQAAPADHADSSPARSPERGDSGGDSTNKANYPGPADQVVALVGEARQEAVQQIASEDESVEKEAEAPNHATESKLNQERDPHTNQEPTSTITVKRRGRKGGASPRVHRRGKMADAAVQSVAAPALIAVRDDGAKLYKAGEDPINGELAVIEEADGRRGPELSLTGIKTQPEGWRFIEGNPAPQAGHEATNLVADPQKHPCNGQPGVFQPPLKWAGGKRWQLPDLRPICESTTLAATMGPFPHWSAGCGG